MRGGENHMRNKLTKAYEITDAKIQFVSLVGKAANKHTFLVTKADDDRASFTTYGRIVKAESHYVTGIVYEPMTEDTDGNYMTEEEIAKACHWFAKNGSQVDLQHSFEPLDGAHVVESWIAKSDYRIDGNPIKKGTWLMTVEIEDDGIWDAVTKGDITGFSMGGLGTFSDVDVDLGTVQKQDKRGLLKSIAEALGFRAVVKGRVAEVYEESAKAAQFWEAFNALEQTLQQYDYRTETIEYEADESTIREALAEFNDIVTAILIDEEPIAKSLATAKKSAVGAPEAKAGDGCSGQEAGEDTSNITKGETDMTKEEVESIVEEAVKKAMAVPEATEEPVEKAEEPEAPDINALVSEAVAKATEGLPEMVEKAVSAAVEPVLKATGLPSNLNAETGGEIKKDETHFLHGIL
ncbi:MAG: XkdF-like putative serine protease domain-containing protein [Bacteroidales bacterium]|nr:XkdF-like putative serine protease domain-containing protein [Bacteroidales bacterium]